ncbi:MAG: nitrate ABC transporter ATP-binding protein [Proteobacteria bacterium ST_bin12]|nr:MAG: nitrate ABC transporter ATP-binding protein [Proteobacteria bacterium ST_bin12]
MPTLSNSTAKVTERYVHIEDVGMQFVTKKGTFEALKNINLSITQGEFLSIIGHSGCGKSTVLNLIAGLLQPTTGHLFCAGREIAAPGPERAVVFQNHSLLPWLSCCENVHLAVERVFGSESKVQQESRTYAALDLVGLSHAVEKRPNEISGGMKQRVGIARALAMEPKVLLLDEPFGALDALTRAGLQDELMRIMQKSGATAVMVTHDVDEAVLLSDKIVMMTNGPSAGIGEILEVDLPYPRKRLELAENVQYNHLRSVVLKFLYERHARKAA